MSISNLNNQDITIIESLIDILEENENSIEEDYNNKEDLISLNKNLKEKLFHPFNNNDEKEKQHNKELVKHAIREYFELQDRDIVFVRSDQIIIKLLNDLSMKEVSTDDLNTIANRYNGINEDDLKSFYDDIFLQEEHDDFFYFVAEVFVKVHMINKRMDNKIYEQSVFPTIQTIITEKLTDYFDHNEEFFKGFSGYIFRIHFKEVFDFIADLMLAKLAASNDYISNFLKYYSMNVVIVNGRRYKVPEIEAQNGWKWNVSSMTPVIKVYIKAEEALSRLEDEINSLESKISEYFVSGLSPVAHNSHLHKDMDKLRQEITFSAKRLDTYIATLKDDQSNTKLKEEIHEIRSELSTCRAEVDIQTSKLITKDIVLKYTDLKRSVDSKTRQKEREEKTIDTNQESFYSIADALVKALTGKKVLLT